MPRTEIYCRLGLGVGRDLLRDGFMRCSQKAGRGSRLRGLWARPVWGILLVAFATALPAAAQNSQTAKPRAAKGAANAAAERGRKLFLQSCGFCHGEDATGGRGPDLVRSTLVAHDVGGNLIGEVIHNGRPAKGMPALPLTAAQIQDIAAFLHARALAALNSGEVPTTYPLSKLLTGNAGRGREYFEGAGGCTACHSTRGDLAHIASKIQPIDLEAKMLYPGYGEKTWPTVTVTLASGEKIEGALLHVDEFDVALRDASGQYHSYSLANVRAEIHDPLAAHRELLGIISQTEMHDLFAFLETLK
jgi:cytochrome c oxidase cbb3-type subunit III